MKRFIRIFQYCVTMLITFIAVDAFCNWHFDVINPVELYNMEKAQYEKTHPDEFGFMSFYEWQIDQDSRDKALWNEIGHQICESFDPWYERNDNPVENTERGRD